MSVLSDLRTVAVHSGFRRLLAVRLISQAGDGAFQAGLATLFFFSPERLATASDVAAAFAVLLLPFTLVGPWAGVLLDRWRRRQVLAYGNAIRVALALTLAAIMATSGVGPWVYVLALVTLSVNRFLLSALSAGLPRVVPRDQLLMANTIGPTLGAASAAVGGAAGLTAGAVIAGVDDAMVLVGAAALFATASALTLRLRPDQLGPVERADAGQMWTEVRRVGRGMVDGARHLIARRTPALALAAMTVHRFIFGVMFLASVLMSRNALADPADAAAGLAIFGTVAAATAAGFGLAVLVTPIVTQRIAPQTWITICLTVGATGQLTLLLGVTQATVLASAGLLGFTAQGAKISVDTIVQRDTDDAFRGRAFALYDVLYNAAFVGAAALGAVVLPDSGISAGTFVALAVVYVATAAGFRTGMLATTRQAA